MLGHDGGHFVGRVGETFWSGRGHFSVIFWMSWDVSGSGLGTLSDRFGKVCGKMSEGVAKKRILKHVREYFSEVGALQISMFNRSKIQKT